MSDTTREAAEIICRTVHPTKKDKLRPCSACHFAALNIDQLLVTSDMEVNVIYDLYQKAVKDKSIQGLQRAVVGNWLMNQMKRK